MSGGGADVSFLSAPSYYVAGLLPSEEFRWNNNAPGTPLSLTYGFMTVQPSYADPNSGNWFGNEFGSFQSFSASQRAGVDRAIQNYENVCNVDFTFLANGDAAQVRFGNALLDAGSAAHAYYPERSVNGDYEGDVWFNTTETYLQNQSDGSYGYFVSLHEIGHTLGLKHPHDASTTLPYGQDSRQYTVMSYNAHPNSPNIEPSTLQLYDIAALQYLYGANTSYKSGNDNWRWLANESFIACIWDGAGNDTLDASNQTRRVVLDLNPGTFSSLGSINGGDAVNNVAIAFDCWIENAIGGSGNDTIYASQAANTITGNGGTDVVSYKFTTGPITFNFSTNVHTDFAAGDVFSSIEAIDGTDWSDTFIGGAYAAGIALRGGFGYDTLVASSGADVFDGGDGNDTVSYASSASAITARLDLGSSTGGFAQGDTLTSVENVTGSNFDDTLIGNSFGNILIGGLGDDYLDGKGGPDSLVGGLGNDTYVWNIAAGVVGSAIEYANEGVDTLRTDRTTYFLEAYIENVVYTGTSSFAGYGTFFANRMEGGGADDRLVSFDGTDTLIGGAGNDVLEGGAGADILDGGINWFDWASYESSNGVTLDLTGGSTGEAAGDTYISIEGFIGSTYNDILRGDAGANGFKGFGGNDTIDGRGGNDAAFYRGRASDYLVTTGDNGAQIVTPLRSSLMQKEGIDTLTSIESIQYEGTSINAAPLIGTTGAALTRNSTTHVWSFFTVTDADLDIVTKYQVRDLTDGVGYLTVDGVTQAANQVVEAAFSGGPNVSYHAGAGSDSMQMRAFDGADWGDWKTITLTPNNTAPIAGAGTHSPAHGISAIAGSALISVSDADGDSMTQYRVFDGTTGNGFFRIGGIARAEQQNITISAADMANTQFVLGSMPGSTDTLWIQAFDGMAWSAWSTFTVTAPTNAAPAAVVNDRTPARGTTSIAAANLVTPSDPDGDAITQYKFFDGTGGNGYFRKSGANQPAMVNITVTAAELAATEFVLGGGSDTLWVQVYDGMTWSAWKTFTVNAPQNNAPLVSINAGSLNPARSVTSVAASSFFAVSDADNDAITQYRFFDGAAGNGRFRLNGADQVELQNITINAADLANFRYQVSTTGVGDTLWVQAFDGLTWSAWKSFDVAAPVNNAPIVTVSNLAPARGTTALAAASLLSVADPDGDAITQYRFFDGTAGSGYFRKGAAVQPEGTNIAVSAAELATTQFVLGGTSDALWVQAYDGAAWSAWQSFTVAPPVNTAPVVTVNNLTPGAAVTSIAGSALLSASDADGDAITQYRFFDGNIGNGRLHLNGNDQVEQQNITVNAADLANFSYRTSTTGAGDTLWVQASDGTSWGAWKSFTVAAPQNNTPVVAASNRQAAASTALAASTLLAVSDADADPITKYQFWDSTPGGGAFRINGAAQPFNANIDVMANQLAATDFLTGAAAGTDQLWARAHDGTSWGEWKTFFVTTLASS